jgi:hypothetical protein
MILKKNNLFLNLFKYLIIFIIAIIVLESFTRIFFFIILKEKNVIKYGFNDDLEIYTLDLSKFEISIFDRNTLNLNDKIKTKKQINNIGNKVVVWTFGGSTTRGNNCGKDSSSWPNELEILNKNFHIINFAQNGYSTDKSIPLLWKNLKKEKPNIIFWAHKFNISKAISGLTRNKQILKHDFKNKNKNKFYLNVKTLDKTLKKNLLFFYFLDQVILRINMRLNIFEKPKNLSIEKEDWDMAIKNYEINTREAISLSRQNDVDKFYIVSLFLEHDIPVKNKSYFNFLYDKTINSIEENTYAKVIDLTQFVDQIKKSNYFCDGMHKTLKGNKDISKKINIFMN